MNLPDYDEIVHLRMQLHHTEMQRDAFKALARKEVMAMIRDVLEAERAIAAGSFRVTSSNQTLLAGPVLGMAYDPSPNWGKPATPTSQPNV